MYKDIFWTYSNMILLCLRDCMCILMKHEYYVILYALHLGNGYIICMTLNIWLGIQRSCDYIYTYTSILNWFTHIQPLLYIIQYKILLTSMHVKLPLKYMIEIVSASRIFYIYIQELNLDRNSMLYLFVHDFFIL